MRHSLMSLKEILRSTQLFGALDEAELDVLAGRSGTRAWMPGKLLFTEGDPCEGLYIVISGRVRIFKTSPGGREHVLAIEGPGSSVAEVPVFDGDSYPASCAAIEQSEILFISRADLRSICMENPEVSLKILRVAGSRLRRLVAIIEELSFTTVRHRLISWLLHEADTTGSLVDRGIVFALTVSHQELAARIGTVRELVSRNLSRLQAENLIEIDGRQVTIRNRDELYADLASMV